MNSNDSSEKVWKILADFSTAMLVTVDGKNVIRARPMAIAGLEKGEKIWFISGADSAKLHEISDSTRVGLVCQKGESVFLAISGDAALVCDPVKVAELWQESFRIWFPGGKEDPSIVLIAVTPTRAEYWDNSGVKKVEFLWDAATAYLTGTTPKPQASEQHGVVQTADEARDFR